MLPLPPLGALLLQVLLLHLIQLLLVPQVWILDCLVRPGLCWNLGPADIVAGFAHVPAPGSRGTLPILVGIADIRGEAMRSRWQTKSCRPQAVETEDDWESSAAPVDVVESIDDLDEATVLAQPDAGEDWHLVEGDMSMHDSAVVPGFEDVQQLPDGPRWEPDADVLDDGFHGVKPLVFKGVVPQLPPPKRLKYDIHDASIGPFERQIASGASSSHLPLPQHVISEAVRLTDKDQFKFPWEKGRLGAFFNPKTNPVLDVLPKLQPRMDNFVKVRVSMDDSAQAAATLAIDPLEVSTTIFTKVVKEMVGESYIDERNARRCYAIKQWAELLSHDWTASAPGVTTHYECLHDDPHSYMCQTLDAVFGLKAPNTLMKRLYGIKAYSDWVVANGYGKWLPFTEYVAWHYLCYLKDGGSSATRGTSFVEAVRFCHFVLGVEGASLVLDSGRIKGRASQMYASKRPWRPADPLTTQEVVVLHQMLEDNERNVVDRLVAGHLLHMIYSRSRFSDLLAVQEVSVDSEGQYLELFAAVHKGARGVDAKSRLLPIVAPTLGIFGSNWTSLYMQLRERAGLTLPSDTPGPMFPAPSKSGADGWCKRYLSSGELNAFLKVVFKASLLENPGRRISTHSLKATGISWCAKFGLDSDCRAILARHSRSVQGATVLYSRDIISEPLRRFVDVVMRIRAKFFQPDMTRGGMITPAANTPVGLMQQPATPPPPQGMPMAGAMPDGGTSDVQGDAAQAATAVSGAAPSNVSVGMAEDDLFPSPSPAEPLESVVKDELIHDGFFGCGEIVDVDETMDLMADWQVESDMEEDDESESDSSTSSLDEGSDALSRGAVETVRRVPISKTYINCRSLVLHTLREPGKFKCGRLLTGSYEAVAELNGLRCGKCFAGCQ